MIRGWRQVAARAIRRDDRRHALAVGAMAGVGSAIAIGLMEWLSIITHHPLFIIPFATSIVLVIGSPDAEPAQPRALIGGHLVSALVGLIVLEVTGPQAWAAAMAVGFAVVAMYLTGTFHPPAGINPLLVVTQGLSWTYLIAPVLAGVLLLAGFAFVWHRWMAGRAWPQRWM